MTTTNFPDVNISELQRNEKWGKEYIDAAISYWKHGMQGRKEGIQHNYSTYNGEILSTTKKFITEKYGKKTSQRFIDYKLGRTKIKLLLGESLDIRFDTNIQTVNREAVSRKTHQVALKMGASFVKEQLDLVKKRYGFNILEGMQVLDNKSPDYYSWLKPKDFHEMVMQWIINKKIQEDMLQIKGHQSLTDVIITSECHGKVEKDAYSNDTYRPIESNNAIFQESPMDPFCLTTPFSGECQRMFLQDVIAKYSLSSTQAKKLKQQGEEFDEKTSDGEVIGGIPFYNVYTIQWRCPRTFYTKVSPSRTGEDYNISLQSSTYEKDEKTIEAEVRSGKYSIQKEYGEEVYEIVRIGQDTYTGFGPLKNQIQTRDKLNKYRGYFDYTHMLYGTVSGTRISLQSIINNMSEIYNVIMFMIARELKKLKGTVFTYNRSARPKGFTMKQILYNAVEHGIIEFATSDADTHSGEAILDASNVIKDFDLGVNDGMKVLLDLKTQIEVTVDRLTGINENREGYGKASQTATGSLQNIEASRSITKDIFFYWNKYMEIVLTKLCEKVKINWDWLDSEEAKMTIGPEGVTYLKATKGLTNDDFAAFLSDGRKEMEIKERSRTYLQQEINAGMLRSKDAIRFEMADTVNQALAILDKAWEQVEAFQNKKNETTERVAQQQISSAHEMAIEDREDKQMHDKETIILKESEKRKTETGKMAGKAVMDAESSQSKERISQQGDKFNI